MRSFPEVQLQNGNKQKLNKYRGETLIRDMVTMCYHDNREIVKCSMALNLGLPRMD